MFSDVLTAVNSLATASEASKPLLLPVQQVARRRAGSQRGLPAVHAPGGLQHLQYPTMLVAYNTAVDLARQRS